MSSALRVRPAGRVTGQVLGEAHGGAGASLPLCVAAHVAPQGSPRFTAGKTGPSRFLASPARAVVEAGTRVTWLWGGRPSSQGVRGAVPQGPPRGVRLLCGALGGCRAPPSPAVASRVLSHSTCSGLEGEGWGGRGTAEAQTVADKQVLLTRRLVLVPTHGAPCRASGSTARPPGPRAERRTAEVGLWAERPGTTAPSGSHVTAWVFLN